MNADQQNKAMARERTALTAAFARCVHEAEAEGFHAGKLWLMFLDRRATELDCQRAEVTEWMRRAIVAIKAEKEG